MTQETLHFSRVSVRILPMDAFTGDVAGQFVQFQGNRQPLLAGHLAITFNLLICCSLGSHMFQTKPASINLQFSLRARQLAGDARVVPARGVHRARKRLE